MHKYYIDFNQTFKSKYIPYKFKYLKGVLGDNNGICIDKYKTTNSKIIENSTTVVFDLIEFESNDKNDFDILNHSEISNCFKVLENNIENTIFTIKDQEQSNFKYNF